MKMRNKKCNHSVFGKLLILISIFIFIPILVTPFYWNEAKYIPSFFIPFLVTFILGIIVCKVTPKKPCNNMNEYTIKDGSITVLFIWITGFIVGAIPFVISGQLSFIQALFESVSGWTTTGLSVVDVTNTPNIFLFHRGFMQFCGGLGFIMFMIIFINEKESMSLYNAEGHPDKLKPNLGNTARTIFFMYATFLVIGTVLYIIFGMSPLDSIVHTMCALSTGGFSNKPDSIGAYNSLWIEAITIILMIIGTTNFAVLLLAIKGKVKKFMKISEVRFMFGVIIFSVPIVAISLFGVLYKNLGESFRQALFNVVSALSTTGYSTVSYSKWPIFSVSVLIILMLIGGGIGSTAGGIKLSRVYLTLRIMKENIKRKLVPSIYVSNEYYYRPQGKTQIDRDTKLDILSFVITYLVIFMTGSLVLTLTAKCSLGQAMFEFASSLGTVGLSIGITGPTTNAATLIVEIIGMMMGRLEIFIVIMGIYFGIHKFKDKIINLINVSRH